jgi:hypothetical protein
MLAEGIPQSLINGFQGTYAYKITVNAGGGFFTDTKMRLCFGGVIPVSGMAMGVSDDTEVFRTQIGLDSTFVTLCSFNDLGWVEINSCSAGTENYLRLNSKWGEDIDTYIYYWIGTDQPINTLGYTLMDTYIDDFGSIAVTPYAVNGGNTRNLNLTVFLEGLYESNGMMHKAMNGMFPKFELDTADHVTVELHDQANYSTVVYSATDVGLRTNGQATMQVPLTLNGNYYITIKHWRTLETVSSVPVSFAGVGDIGYNFHTSAAQAYGNNMKNLAGTYVFYSGDVTSFGINYPSPALQDGLIDIDDLYYIYGSNLNGNIGYHVSDLDGNGIVDIDDVYLVFFNNLNGIVKATL